MKKIIFLFSFITFCLTSNAQCPLGLTFLTSQAEVDNFATDYPGCTSPPSLIIRGSGITNLNGLSHLTSINGGLTVGTVSFGTSITDFTGLNNVTSIAGRFFISDNLLLTSLSGLENVTSIGSNVIFGNDVSGDEGNPLLTDFSAFQNLQTIGGDFEMVNHEGILNLDDFSSVTSIGGRIKIRNNVNLVSASGLNVGTIGGEYLIYQNPMLVDLPVVLGINGKIEISNNPMLQSLSGLENLTEVSELGLRFNDNLSEITALANLTNVYDVISIYENPSLESLDGLQNVENAERLFLRFNDQLVNIDALSNLDPSVLNTLQITVNPLLSNCAILPICQYLAAGNGIETLIHSNAVGCGSEIEIINECLNSSIFNNISGTILFDETNNGCGAGDVPAQFVPVMSTDGTSSYTTYTNALGQYALFVFEGSYTTTSAVNNSIFTIDPPSNTSIFSGIGQSDTSDFCITATNMVDDVSVSVSPSWEARPGFNTRYDLVFQNRGSATLSGEVSLVYDQAKMVFLESDLPPDTTVPGLLSWDYVDLSPFEVRTIELNYQMLFPPAVEIGDVNILTATVSPIGSDIHPEDNTFVLEQVVVGSFDPNDKTVLEGDRVHIDDVDEYLHYLIRFQNTGTASAINVRVNDVLDEKLELSTFEPLSFSHDVRIVKQNNQFQFRFDDINLPDSISNEPESHGHILFRIKPKNDVVLGDIIEGTAAIYFDFNPPVITNTVMTEFVDNERPMALDDTFEVDEAMNSTFSIVANDSDDVALNLSSIVFTDLPTKGSVVDNGDGSITYTHDDVEVLEAEQDYLRYTIQDNEGIESNIAVVTVTIQPVNDAPVAENDMLTVNQGDSGTVDVVGNDSDADGTLDLTTIEIITSPSVGTLQDNGDGTISYVHDGSTVFVDSFDYTIDDNEGETSNGATVLITINEVLSINVPVVDGFAVYPNPANDFVYLQGNFKYIAVYNMFGQLIVENKQFPLDVSQLSAGVYVIYVADDFGVSTSYFVKK